MSSLYLNLTNAAVQRVVTLLAISLVIAGCTPARAPISDPSAITVIQSVVAQAVFPQAQIGVWQGQDDTPRLVWAGDPQEPNLRLWSNASGTATLTRLPLGITPRALTGYALPAGRAALLWLDQKQPGDYFLYAATLDNNDAVDRGPVRISTTPAASYRAVVLADGGLLIVWSAAPTPGKRAPIYVQKLDVLGRARPAFTIAPDGVLPSITLDFTGDAHITWLETRDGALWTTRYLRLTQAEATAGELTRSADADSLTATIARRAVPLGVTRLESIQTPSSMHIMADQGALYVLWVWQSTVALQGSQPQNNGTGNLVGLAFPIGQPDRALAFAPDAESQKQVVALQVLTSPDNRPRLLAWDTSGLTVYARGTVTNSWIRQTVLPVSDVVFAQVLSRETADDTINDVIVLKATNGVFSVVKLTAR